jgi:hypothetical protein
LLPGGWSMISQKSGDLVSERMTVKYAEQHPVTFMCDQPGAVRQRY